MASICAASPDELDAERFSAAPDDFALAFRRVRNERYRKSASYFGYRVDRYIRAVLGNIGKAALLIAGSVESDPR